jgi:hypothetical protein
MCGAFLIAVVHPRFVWACGLGYSFVRARASPWHDSLLEFFIWRLTRDLCLFSYCIGLYEIAAFFNYALFTNIIIEISQQKSFCIS